MRLIRAELRKLRRPLVVWVLALGALLAVVLAWGGLANDRAYLASPGYRAPAPVSCPDLGLSDGPECRRRLVAYRQAAEAAVRRDIARGMRQVREAAVLDVQVEQPVGSGAMAGGLMASLPGVVLVALLAAGHVGGEWNGRTLKTVLTVEGRRWRLLGAKIFTVWLGSLAALGAMWAALAATTPIWHAAFPLPVHHPGVREQWAHAWPVLWHSTLTLGVFSVLAVTASVVTRSVIGTLTATIGVVVAALVAAGFPAVRDWSPATWVSAWTRFPAQANVVTSFWARVSSPAAKNGLQQPNLGWAVALAGLAAVAVVCAALSAVRLRRMDIT